MIDLKKLQNKFDTLFDQETEESFNNWLGNKRLVLTDPVRYAYDIAKKEIEDFGKKNTYQAIKELRDLTSGIWDDKNTTEEINKELLR